MKTGSLRARVTVTTLALLAIVLAGVVTTVTLAYRAKLDGDLRTGRVTGRRLRPARRLRGTAKRLLPGLALEGIATRITPPPRHDAATIRRPLDGPDARIAAHPC